MPSSTTAITLFPTMLKLWRCLCLLIAWLNAQGIPFLDLLPAARAVPAMADGQRHLYHLRDTHFNVRGNQMAGEQLAKFLKDRLPD